MNFKFKASISEKDYLDFNLFWNFKSPYGKKEILKFRIFLIPLFAFVIFLSLFAGAFTLSAFIGVIPYLILFVIFQLILKPVFIWSFKIRIKSMKKKGKLPYSETSELEFLEESFVEITPYNKSEVKYSVIERVSVVDDKVIYIHFNNLAACILPFSSFESKEQCEEFIAFIKTKCSTVDIY